MTLEAWLEVVDDVAPGVLGPADRRGEALAAEVRGLSEIYTRRRHALGDASTALAARLRFFFPRDLLKVNGPLGELAEADALPAGPTWQVLDVGAGLGTSTLGIAAFAKARGIERIEVTAIERDSASLDVFESLARAAATAGLVPPITLEKRRADVSGLGLSRLPKADLVVVGLALNELFRDRADADRLDASEAFVRRLLAQVRPGGALLVIEPALKETSRILQRIRDRLPEHVFAPCLRAGECPLLRRDRDWCHAALPLELPKPLAAIAKGAGLRSARLTFAYLTLREGAQRQTGFGDPRALRIVGGPVGTKGKTEWDACGEVGLVRLRLLDREVSESNEALDGALRGARIRMPEPPVDGSSVRIRPTVEIERI